MICQILKCFLFLLVISFFELDTPNEIFRCFSLKMLDSMMERLFYKGKLRYVSVDIFVSSDLILSVDLKSSHIELERPEIHSRFFQQLLAISSTYTALGKKRDCFDLKSVDNLPLPSSSRARNLQVHMPNTGRNLRSEILP